MHRAYPFSVQAALAQVVFSFTGLVQSAHGGLFLARLSDAELKRVLLAEIEAAIGGNLHDITKRRLNEVQSALRPTFDIIKNEDGKLDHDGMRYLLNRFFYQQHGWKIIGLQANRDPAAKSTPTFGMKDRLPEVVQDLFEKRIGSKGFGMKDVVSLAAVIEHFIRDELQGRLASLYSVMGFDPLTGLNEVETIQLMQLYMINFLRGDDASQWKSSRVEIMESRFHKQYTEWPTLKMLIKEVYLKTLTSRDRANASTSWDVFFEDIALMLEELADRFAAFYGSQCQGLKNALLEMEDGANGTHGSGRVRLADFYDAGMEKLPMLKEQVDTLRGLGALDEADASNTRVIIPNYVSGLSNCIARTSFYSTCCADSCGPILDRIEGALGKAEATREEIVDVVKDERGAMTHWLLQRLEDVARHHNGRIPLHGRLFAQWLHFLYPRDCIYPHLSGSTIGVHEINDHMSRALPLTLHELRDMSAHLNEISLNSGDDSTGSGGRQLVGSADTEDQDDASLGMWTMDEELFMERSLQELGGSSGSSSNFARWVLAMGALMVAAGLLRVVWPFKKSVAPWGAEGAFVAKNV